MDAQLKMLCDRDDWSGAIKFASGKPIALSQLAEAILEKCPASASRDCLLRVLISILARMGLFEKAGRLILLISPLKMVEGKMVVNQMVADQEEGLRNTILEAIDEGGAI